MYAWQHSSDFKEPSIYAEFITDKWTSRLDRIIVVSIGKSCSIVSYFYHYPLKKNKTWSSNNFMAVNRVNVIGPESVVVQTVITVVVLKKNSRFPVQNRSTGAEVFIELMRHYFEQTRGFFFRIAAFLLVFLTSSLESVSKSVWRSWLQILFYYWRNRMQSHCFEQRITNSSSEPQLQSLFGQQHSCNWMNSSQNHEFWNQSWLHLLFLCWS